MVPPPSLQDSGPHTDTHFDLPTLSEAEEGTGLDDEITESHSGDHSYALNRSKQVAPTWRPTRLGLLSGLLLFGAVVAAAIGGARLLKRTTVELVGEAPLRRAASHPQLRPLGPSGYDIVELTDRLPSIPEIPNVTRHGLHPIVNTSGLPESSHRRYSTSGQDLGGLPPLLPFRSESLFESRWGLLNISEVEGELPIRLKFGKQVLASALAEVGGFHPGKNKAADMGTKVLAKAISDGATDSLLGLDILLTNTRSLGTKRLLHRSFRTTQLLGWGTSNIVIEIREHSTGEQFAMSILYRLVEEDDGTVADVGETGNRVISEELEVMRQACGRVPVAEAGFKRGIAVSLFTGSINGLPAYVVEGNMVVFTRVQVMERMEEDVKFVLSQIPVVPTMTKEYIARMLLLQVLHLQESGVSHNDIKLENCFMRKDGSFALGDFGSSNLFNTPRQNQFTEGTNAYIDPSLIIDAQHGYEDIPDPKCDMWSLGTVLYELFMDGETPYAVSQGRHSIDAIFKRAEYLMEGRFNDRDLLLRMEAKQVPYRWRGLIQLLLQPQLPDRIDAQTVATAFRDLYLK